jgi:hypothetical protein
VTWQVLVKDPPNWFKSLLPPRLPKLTVLTLQENEQWKNETKPSAPGSTAQNSTVPLYPVLQGGTEEHLLSLPPPYQSPPLRVEAPEPQGPGEAEVGPTP